MPAIWRRVWDGCFQFPRRCVVSSRCRPRVSLWSAWILTHHLGWLVIPSSTGPCVWRALDGKTHCTLTNAILCIWITEFRWGRYEVNLEACTWVVMTTCACDLASVCVYHAVHAYLNNVQTFLRECFNSIPSSPLPFARVCFTLCTCVHSPGRNLFLVKQIDTQFLWQCQILGRGLSLPLCYVSEGH